MNFSFCCNISRTPEDGWLGFASSLSFFWSQIRERESFPLPHKKYHFKHSVKINIHLYPMLHGKRNSEIVYI